MATIGDRIKEQRKRLGFTQAELGKRLNVTDRAVSKWEQNEGNPDISIIASLAAVLNVSIDYLLTGKIPEEKVIIKSPKEMLLETDDPQYLEKIRASDLNIVEMYENKLVNTFGYLVDNEKIRAYCSSSRYSGYNDYITEILYLLLISNRLDKIKIFGFNDIGFADDKEFTEEMLDAFVSDERVSDATREYVLTIHCRELISVNQGYVKNTDSFHQYGNWQTLYPRILGKYVAVKKWDWVNRLLDLIESINKPGAEKYQTLKKNHEEAHLQFKPSGAEYGGIKVIAISSKTLDILLDEKQYDLLQKANSINESIDQYTISKRTIDLKKMQNSTATLKEKLVFEFVQNGILGYSNMMNRDVEIDGMKAEDGDQWFEALLHQYKDLYHEILLENPISLIELAYRSVAEQNLSALFRVAVDYDIKALIDAMMEGNPKKILSVAKELFIYTEKKLEPYNRGQTLYKISGKWDTCKYGYGLQEIPDASVIPSDTAEAIQFFNQIKEKIFEDWVEYIESQIGSLQKKKENFETYNKVKSELTSEYFEKEIAGGNLDAAIIKACVKLESILKYCYHYEGELSVMLANFFDEHETEELLKKQLSKLRMKRNSIVHAENNSIDFTIDDLRSCLAIIADLEC